MSIIEHDERARRFSTTVDHLRAVLDYQLRGRMMTITHTGVPQPISGRGIAAALMKAALSAAKAAGWEVTPACSYAAAYLRRHSNDDKQHQDDLLDEALDESFPASDSPSVGGSN